MHERYVHKWQIPPRQYLGFQCATYIHNFYPPIMLTIDLNLVIMFGACIPISCKKFVFLLSILGDTPNNISRRYRCSNKKNNQIRVVCLIWRHHHTTLYTNCDVQNLPCEWGQAIISGSCPMWMGLGTSLTLKGRGSRFCLSNHRYQTIPTYMFTL